MKIGLLSDTHGFLDSDILEYFKECDEIWHAGDIGNPEVVQTLEKFRPLRAIYGNIDGGVLRKMYSEDLEFTCAGAKILMSHIGGKPPNYNKRVRKLIQIHNPDIFICGHSHILRVIYDEKNSILYINPGAAGKHGFHRVRTVIRFEIMDSRPKNMEVIELGKRA